jgi:hypothetical protein
MDDEAAFVGKLGLADFLSDLRSELAEAMSRAQNEPLKLHVEDVTLSLDLGVTVDNTASGEVAAKAKFWVFASVEGKVGGEHAVHNMTTQHVTLTLKPRMETVTVDANGRPATATSDVDVSSPAAATAERVQIPAPQTTDP